MRDHPADCTLAYWHFPRFSSGLHGSSTLVRAYWDLLYEAGAEVVLTGHDHSYERFAPQGTEGEADPVAGIFPALARDEFWEAVFQLLYTQHGGSGLSLTLEEVMDLELDRIFWLLERLGEQRRKEAHEIQQAARRGRRK